MLADSTSTTDGATFCPQSKYEKAFNVSKSLVQLFTSFWCKFYKQQQTNKTQQQQTTGLNNNKQLDSTTTNNWTQQQQTARHNNNKPTMLNHTKPQCHPIPKSINQGLIKAPKTSVSSDALQNPKSCD